METTRAPDLITSEMTSLMNGLSVSSPSVRSRITPPGPPGLSSFRSNDESIKFEFWRVKTIYVIILTSNAFCRPHPMQVPPTAVTGNRAMRASRLASPLISTIGLRILALLLLKLVIQ
jgi:hypothetical protein